MSSEDDRVVITPGSRPRLVVANDGNSAGQYSERINSAIAGEPVAVVRDNPKITSRKTPKSYYISVSILFLVNLLNYMDRFTISGVLTSVQSYYNIADSEAGLLQTVFICSYMIFAPVCGYLGDRYSRKWIMACGILIWSATVLASTFIPANHFWAFALCRGIVGIGEASYSTVSPTIIADMFSKDLRSRMLMIFYFAIPVGSGLGFVVGTNVANMAGTWQWGVRVTPILGAMCLILIVVVLKEPKRGEAEEKGSNSDFKATTWMEDLKSLTKNKSYLWSSFGFTCVAFVAGSLSWWTPNFVFYAISVSGKAPNKAQIGLIFGVITCLSGFLGVFIGSFWAQMWRRTNPRADPLVCGMGMLLCTPFLYAALNIVDLNILLAWPLMFCAVTALCLNWAIVSDMLLYIVIPPRRATASALQILFSHLFGDAFSPYLIGVLSDALRGNENTDFMHFYSLKYAMFIPSFLLVFGGFFFFGTAWFIEDDKKKCDLEIKRMNASDAGVFATKASALRGDDSTGTVIPYSDSTARLLRADADGVNGFDNR